MHAHPTRARILRPALALVTALVAAPAVAQSTPEGTRVLGVRAGSACLTEQVRVTGFALAREESGAGIPFDGYRITEILLGEGDAVTSGQEILRAVRQPGLPGGDQPGAARPQTPDSYALRAPIAGRITRLNARVGMVTGAPSTMPGTAPPPPAQPGMPDPMVRIVADAGTDLMVDVPSPYASKIRAGTEVRIVPDEGADIRGSVRVPVAEVDPRTQLGRARLSVEPANALRPGQFASAVIETARDCGVSVPRGAVTYRDGVPTVQVLNGTRVETRSIRTGLSNETTVQVREGLADDEPVVANAGTALRAGDRVTPVITGKVGGCALMAVNISAYAIRKPLPSIVASIILLALGWASFSRLPVTRLPSADIPLVSVVVAQFGAAPAEIESQVTKTIEDGVSGVEGVRHIASSVTDGLSVTTIAFRLETNTDRALNDVKDAVTRVRAALPQSVQEPLIQRVDVVGLPIVTYAATAPDKSPEQISWFMENTVKRSLQDVKGVAEAAVIGGVTREILVSLDPDRLQAFGLSAVDVSRRLYGTNVTVTGGRAEIGGRDQAIRTLASARTLDDLAGTMLTLPTGGQVRLADLGQVSDTIADRRTFARLNGEPVVAIGMKRAQGASDVVVAKAVETRVAQIRAENPDFDLKLIDTSVDFTLGNYEAAISTLFEGAILAVVIVFLFLRDLRATVIVAVSLPLSIFPAFWAMDALGFSLNLVSFLAITLSTGILVDDSIVEIENIVRHMRMGKPALQAAIDAADEIGLAVIAISLTIIAIFAPASFMSGIAGQFFKQFGITVAVQVFFSLLAARFVTPMLAAYIMKPHEAHERPPGRILRAYTRLVTFSVQHYLLTLLIGLGFFAASIGSISLLSKGFLPAQDSSRSVMALELPPGSQLAETEKVTEDIVKVIRGLPEVRSVFVDGGRVPKEPIESRRASFIVNYTAKKERSITQRDLEREIGSRLRAVPDIRFYFVDENGLRAISLVVRGTDPRTVANVSDELAGQMRRLPAVANVISGTTLNRPELQIRPHLDLAARLGVSPTLLAETIRVATIGDVGPALAKFDAGDRLVPIRVQLDDSARVDQRVLEQVRVPKGGGGSIPLSAIADLDFQQGPTNISRYDRMRQATVACDLVANAALGDVLKAIDALPVMKSLPKGVTVDQGGDAESLNELADGFAKAMSAGLMMVYAVLVLLFGSFLLPITILFSLPLSLGGAVIALMITGKQLTTPVWIGILMLMGIVTKNAIMLIDFAVESIRHGMAREAAIIDAGQKRARPIVMTTIAMVAGMLPSALAFGIGGEFRSPMALAVIGGLILSTLLSLVFVPAVFVAISQLSDLSLRLARRIGSVDLRRAKVRPEPSPGETTPMPSGLDPVGPPA